MSTNFALPPYPRLPLPSEEAKALPPVLTKECSTCKATLNLDAFYPNKVGKHNVSGSCKICTQANRRAKTFDHLSVYTEKECKECKRSKFLLDFTICNTNVDGHSGTCKECIRARRPPSPPAPPPVVMVTVTYKACIECKETKVITEFYKHVRTADGRFKLCKDCYKIRYVKVRSSAPSITITEKICNKCKRTKPVNEFHKSKQIKDGFANTCKPCIREYRQARY